MNAFEPISSKTGVTASEIGKDRMKSSEKLGMRGAACGKGATGRHGIVGRSGSPDQRTAA